MNQSRTEIKVGIAALLVLALVAELSLQLGKGNALFRKTYTIILQTRNVGGIRKKAEVLMSGVTVGTVTAITLDPDGTNASIYLQIYGQYKIRDDARFLIEQSSFLSDQFVAIHPDANKGTVFTNRSIARVEEPFNLMKAARSGSDTVKSGEDAVRKLDEGISKIRREFLSEKNLTNFAFQIATERQDAEGLRASLEQVDSFIQTNDLPASIGKLATNLEKWNGDIVSTEGKLQSKGAQISAKLEKWEAVSATLTNRLNEVQQGKGPAGAVFGNQEMADRISNLTARLAMESSNINQEGLWHVLFTTNKTEGKR